MCGLTRFYCFKDQEFRLIECDEGELLSTVIELKLEGWEIEDVVKV